jgi:hypothetical protein
MLPTLPWTGLPQVLTRRSVTSCYANCAFIMRLHRRLQGYDILLLMWALLLVTSVPIVFLRLSHKLSFRLVQALNWSQDDMRKFRVYRVVFTTLLQGLFPFLGLSSSPSQCLLCQLCKMVFKFTHHLPSMNRANEIRNRPTTSSV